MDETVDMCRQGRIKEREGSKHVGPYEIRCIGYRPVYVAFCGKMNNGPDFFPLQQVLHQDRVTDVPVNEPVPAIRFNIAEICRISCVGQFVEVENCG